MYALHSFAATVEGQANGTKGDMLVLLDDTNSYWWLVRIVKDHSVGNSLNVLYLLFKDIFPPKRSKLLKNGSPV